MENRNGLVVDVMMTQATGKAEREAALTTLGRLPKRRRRRTLGADKGYDTRDFVRAVRQKQVTPLVTQNQSGRRSAIRRAGDASWRLHGESAHPQAGGAGVWWEKTVAGGRKLRYVARKRNRLWAELTATAYNLVRMAKLSLQSTAATA